MDLRFLANEPAQSLSNLISHFSKDYELPIRRGGGRIFKTPMESPTATGKYRARFLCAVADGEDVVELLAGEFIHRLRAAFCDVDSDLSHCRDSIRIQTDRACACAEHLEAISSEVS
jgi:hypothetical protein